MGVKLKLSYVEANTEDTVACKYGNMVTLLKLKLKKFDGNILKWQEFWDAFDSTIHQNERLQKVDKFNYLRSQLVGLANETIAGFNLKNGNYHIAIKLLMIFITQTNTGAIVKHVPQEQMVGGIRSCPSREQLFSALFRVFHVSVI